MPSIIIQCLKNVGNAKLFLSFVQEQKRFEGMCLYGYVIQTLSLHAICTLC